MATHALAGVAQLVGASSGTQKVVGSINSWSGRIPTLQGLIPGPGVCVCVCGCMRPRPIVHDPQSWLSPQSRCVWT